MSTANVLRDGYGIKMIWAHAVTRVAKMVEAHAVRNSAARNGEGVAMSDYGTILYGEDSVPAAATRPCVNPALAEVWTLNGNESAVLVHLAPESFLRSGLVRVPSSLQPRPVDNAMPLRTRWGLTAIDYALRGRASIRASAASIPLGSAVPTPTADVLRAHAPALWRLLAAFNGAFRINWVPTNATEPWHFKPLSMPIGSQCNTLTKGSVTYG